MKIEVNENDVRLDKFLAGKLEKSRSQIQKLIKEGLITKEGKILNSNYLVNDGDIIVIEEKNDEITIESFDIELDIVYEDSYLLIINKQSGLVVHPAPGHYNDTLVNAIVNKFSLSNNDKIRPGIVHRIDKDTSGLMIVAKDDKTHDLIAEMIKEKKVERIYWALVEGVIKHDTGTIDAPIGRDSNNRQKMAVTDKNSKDAITHFRVLKRFNDKTLVECKLETGRTHQIRVHFNYIKYPIVGDPVYGKKNNNDPFGQYLHSKSIRFIHPITKEKIYFETELPIEFKTKLEQLEV